MSEVFNKPFCFSHSYRFLNEFKFEEEKRRRITARDYNFSFLLVPRLWEYRHDAKQRRKICVMAQKEPRLYNTSYIVFTVTLTPFRK